MKAKVFLVAAVMIACVFATVCYTDASDADISTDAPNMRFYVYSNNAWTCETGQGYNAAIALADTSIAYTWASETVNGTSVTGAQYTYSYTNYGSPYSSINPYYGELATVNGSSDFTVYYYDGSNWISNSVLGLKSIGFYKPFDDYTLKTANIAFVPTGVSPNTLPTTGLQALENVIPTEGTPNSAYAVDFYINGATTPVVGYGSDCATAFKDAMIRNNIQYTIDLSMVYTDNNNVQYLNLNYYGHVTRIVNQTQQDSVVAVYDSVRNITTVTGEYYYWSLTLSDESDSSYMLGFYSPLSYAPMTDSEFWFDYAHDIFTWEEQGDTTGKYNN
jgi:hypothetical protein